MIRLIISEALAVVFTLISVYLTMKKNVMCWPTGIIAVWLYGVVFFNVKLYADMILQIIFLAQCAYGWLMWSSSWWNDEEKITKMSDTDVFYYSLATTITFSISHWLLKTYTDASLPLFDSAVSALSLMANFMLSRKQIENWFLWITADVLYVGIFIYKELYLSSLLYLVLLFMAINGYKQWKLMYEQQDLQKGFFTREVSSAT